MAAELPLPNRVFAHGWWTNEGQKISKSLGNVIDPYKEIAWLESFKYKEVQDGNSVEKNISKEIAVDYFRYFLLKEVPFGNDGDYSRENLINRINAELANNIGNLVQRSLAMIVKNCDSLIPDSTTPSVPESAIEEAIKSDINNLAFNHALDKIIDLSNHANKYFNDQAPWVLKKEGKVEEMNQVLFQTAESIRIIALLLLPFIPESANKILNLLNIKEEERNLLSLDKSIKSGQKINPPQIIFPSIKN
jgi:methionyl-tRNA synthetase